MKNKRIFALSMAALWSMVFGNAMHGGSMGSNRAGAAAERK